MKEAEKQSVLLTVFTPTFNRLHTLRRTYQSMQDQTCRDFIWLIIDDGSSDGTGEEVRKWQEETEDFEIRYVFKENGGMHTAHNEAYRRIDTELNVCIDSDDLLAPDAVRMILDKWEAVKGRDDLAGLIALDADLQRKVIGRGFPDGMKETTVHGYYTGGGLGDKKLIYRTEVINRFPEYPVFEGEKYFSLAYKYRLIDQAYVMAVLPEIVCYVDYQPDGSTNSMLRQYINNPKSFAFWRKLCLEYPTGDSLKRQFVNCIHYVSSSLLAGNLLFLKESPRRGMTAAAFPLGLAMTAYIKLKTRGK